MTSVNSRNLDWLASLGPFGAARIAPAVVFTLTILLHVGVRLAVRRNHPLQIDAPAKENLGLNVQLERRTFWFDHRDSVIRQNLRAAVVLGERAQADDVMTIFWTLVTGHTHVPRPEPLQEVQVFSQLVA